MLFKTIYSLLQLNIWIILNIYVEKFIVNVRKNIKDNLNKINTYPFLRN